MVDDYKDLDDAFSATDFEEQEKPDLAPAVKLEVGEDYVGLLVSSEQVKSKFLRDGQPVMNTMYKFIGRSGESEVMFSKGNLPYLMDSIEPGQLVKIVRLPDEQLKNGFMASTFQVLVGKK